MVFLSRSLIICLLLLVSTSIYGRESATQFLVSADYMMVHHKNNDSNGELLNTEKGWLPGVQLALSQKSNRMISTFSAEMYTGEVNFNGKASNGNLVSTTRQNLSRFSYRLSSNEPWQNYQFYGEYGFHNWRRNVLSRGDVSGIERQYEWSTLESGVRFGIYASRKTVINADIGVSRSFFSKMLVNLREHNLGKPLLRLKDKFGYVANVELKRMFSRKHGVNFCIKARYWQFGISDIRAVENNVEKVQIREPESETANVTFSASYLFLF